MFSGNDSKKLNSPLLILLLLLLTGLISCKDEVIDAMEPKSKVDYKNQFLKAEKHFENQVYDSAYYYYNESKLACDVLSESEKIIYSLLKMAVIQQIQGDYSNSETTITEAMPLFQETTKTVYKIAAYNILGINYERLYDFKNAVLYYNKALNVTGDPLQKAILTNNIAVTHIGANDYESALKLLFPLSHDINTLDDEENYARIIDNLGYCYFKTNNLKSVDYLRKH